MARRRAWYLVLVALVPLGAWGATGVGEGQRRGGIRASTGPAPAPAPEPPPTTEAPVSQDYFRFVVAHEICHVLQFDATGDSTEAQADACAVAHGARR